MNANQLAPRLANLFALALRLYPAGVQRECGEEMAAVFRLHAADAAKQGAWALAVLAFREVRGLPVAILSAHFHAVRGRMEPVFPTTSDQTPWPAALLSLLPFFIAGSLRIIVSYQPGWSPVDGSQRYLLYLLLSCLAVAGGLVVGAVKKFPRWAYPYVVTLAFSLSLMVAYAVYLFHFSLYGQNGFFLTLLMLLIPLWLPPLRAFYRRIAQDWTLASYGLYAFVLYILASIEYEGHPTLDLMALLPPLMGLVAALAHLRIRDAFARFAALLVGTFLGLLIWLTPFFLGMISIWAGILIGVIMMLVYGTILLGLLLAPLVIARAVRMWLASRAAR